MDALCVGIHSKKVSFILDADIRSFFDEISQEWLIRFLEHRIADRRIIRLIQKWLKAGVLEDGIVTVGDRGTGQGSVISPMLANIYLHYALDLWAARWRRREATGDMIIVRYADDFIIGFQHENDARRFLDEMRERLGKFALSLHPEKTRLIEFGRFAAERRGRRGLGKPETFNFLGFTFICGKTRAGKFQIKRKTWRDRMRAKLKMIKAEMWRRMHQPIPAQGKWLGRVVRGYFNYYAVPTNARALDVFRHHVTDLWRRTLRRRSQKDRLTWARMTQLAEDWLPKPIILHPWPSDRFAVTHPRWEPYAGKPHVRFCAGAYDETHVPTATAARFCSKPGGFRSGVALQRIGPDASKGARYRIWARPQDGECILWWGFRGYERLGYLEGARFCVPGPLCLWRFFFLPLLAEELVRLKPDVIENWRCGRCPGGKTGNSQHPDCRRQSDKPSRRGFGGQ